MIKKIIMYLIVAMVLSFIALWLWEGGYNAVARYVQFLPNPLSNSSSTYEFILPGQPAFPSVPDTTGYTPGENYGQSDYQNPQDEMSAPTQTSGTTYGERSPYAGQVSLSAGNANETNPSAEYVVVSSHASVPVAVSGWSLVSAISGTRVVIPLAASPFVRGTINSGRGILLSPYDEVIVHTGASPVGVSFRENMCTGYLAQTQDFIPAISNACPRPADMLSVNAENLARYGSDCIDYMRDIPQCTFPTSMPANLSSQCKALITNTFSYNGCVQTFRTTSGFDLPTWHAYLGFGSEVWKNNHDAIRLLDDRGRVVDAIVY